MPEFAILLAIRLAALARTQSNLPATEVTGGSVHETGAAASRFRWRMGARRVGWAVRPTLRRDIYPIVIRAKLMKPDLIGGYRHKSARHRGG